MTPLDLITMAFKSAGVIGVGQTPQSEDANDALFLLNSMLATWGKNRWLNASLNNAWTASTGKQFYTIGKSTSDFNAPRPDKIEFAFARLNPGQTAGSGAPDYELSILPSYEDYAAIRLKLLKSWPSTVYYEPSYPEGKLWFYPIPNDQFELHILAKAGLGSYTLSDTITLPPEYTEALLWNLAARLRTAYGLPQDAAIVALANGALATIRNSNTQMRNMRLPAGLAGRRSWSGHGIGGIIEGTATLNQSGLG